MKVCSEQFFRIPILQCNKNYDLLNLGWIEAIFCQWPNCPKYVAPFEIGQNQPAKNHSFWRVSIFGCCGKICVCKRWERIPIKHYITHFWVRICLPCVWHPDNRRVTLFADLVDRLRLGGQIVHGRDNEMWRVVNDLNIVVFVVRARAVRGRPYRNCRW